jgi:hypothetical protein
MIHLLTNSTAQEISFTHLEVVYLTCLAVGSTEALLASHLIEVHEDLESEEDRTPVDLQRQEERRTRGGGGGLLGRLHKDRRRGKG